MLYLEQSPRIFKFIKMANEEGEGVTVDTERGMCLPGKIFFTPFGGKNIWKKTYLFSKNQGLMKSKICMSSLFFTDRRAFRTNLTCSGKS